MVFSTAVLTAVLLAVDPGSEVPLRQEFAGVELAPFSMNAGSPRYGESPSRLQPGLGGTLRLGRHKWSRTYWTPVMGGVFVAPVRLPDADVHGDSYTIFAHVATEGGVRVATRAGTLEWGLAAGAHILSLPYFVSSGCGDGTCVLGSKGLLLSPVFRWLFRERPNHTVGISLRATLPINEPHGELFGSYGGRGALFLVALDLGAGFQPQR